MQHRSQRKLNQGPLSAFPVLSTAHVYACACVLMRMPMYVVRSSAWGKVLLLRVRLRALAQALARTHLCRSEPDAPIAAQRAAKEAARPAEDPSPGAGFRPLALPQNPGRLMMPRLVAQVPNKGCDDQGKNRCKRSQSYSALLQYSYY